ncbi:MAG: hypothetical protein RLZZ366_811 [Pseudomonadota bacterium]|jgi:hypothetical protein
MSEATIVAFDAMTPVPDMSVLELGVIICCVRQPGSDLASIAVELGRWFNTSLVESDLAAAIRRLTHREWLRPEGPALHAVEDAREKAEFAARGIVRLAFRDRYFFDVGKLLDVAIVREDHFRED